MRTDDASLIAGLATAKMTAATVPMKRTARHLFHQAPAKPMKLLVNPITIVFQRHGNVMVRAIARTTAMKTTVRALNARFVSV